MIKTELSVFNNITFTVVLSCFIWLYIAETSSWLWILINTYRVRRLIFGVYIYLQTQLDEPYKIKIYSPKLRR